MINYFMYKLVKFQSSYTRHVEKQFSDPSQKHMQCLSYAHLFQNPL
jgi:hypothetical protein